MTMNAPPITPAHNHAITPTVHTTIQCQQQTTDWRPGIKHMSMVDCARGLVAAKGVANGLYRGFWSLAWRYVHAIGERSEGGD